MSREVVYWLMSLKADGLSLLAYDDSKSIALLSIDDALYEIDYTDVETCFSTPIDRLNGRLKQVGRLISGLSVKSAESDVEPVPFAPNEEQPDRRVG